MPTTTRGYRYPLGGEAFNPPVDIGELASDIDADVGQLADSLVRYYDAGAGTLTGLTTSPAAPAGGASLALPADTYDIDVSARFALDVSTIGRVITLYLFAGSTQVFDTGFTVSTTDLESRNHVDFIRLTFASTTTLSIRAGANATGGTQGITANRIRAVKVP